MQITSLIDYDLIWANLMCALNNTIRESQDELRGREDILSDIQEVEERCFDACDRLMASAAEKLERSENRPLKITETQPKTAHEHQRNLEPQRSDSGHLELQKLDPQGSHKEESDKDLLDAKDLVPSNPPHPQTELRRSTRPRKPTDRFTLS
jgi:hypothetical protein